MKKESRGALVGGLILIFVGMAVLANQALDIDGGIWGSFIVLALGGIFLLAGMVTREFGFFVPGGILTGIGSGIALVGGPWQNTFAPDNGGAFLLAFAGGWFLITLMGLLFTRQFHWWPLIPGSIIGFIGLSLTFGGVLGTALAWLGTLWPLALIAGGLIILVRALVGHEKRADDISIEKKA